MNNRKNVREVPIIDHVGIAVNSLEEATQRWTELLGSEATGQETVASEGVRVAFFGEGAGRIELLAPLGEDTPIARFLSRRGPGIHHLCVRVPDLDLALERAESGGAEVIPPRIRPGSGGGRVAFLHPSTGDGVLLELREDPEAS